jgi:hypothetical protein
MNRYSLEMHAREKYQTPGSNAPSRRGSLARSPLFTVLLFQRMKSPKADYFEPAKDDSMTFLYELRRDLVDLELDEVLPLIK